MPHLFEFEGRWRIARRIEDHWMGRTGLFEGVARFHPDGAGLVLDEVGELRLPQEVPMVARRRYLWREEGDALAVLYEDGSPFHRIAHGAPVVQAWHGCDPDDYEVTYNFTRWPAWRMVWRVRGPRKDYTSISDFTRL
ncbi:MAG: trigger factor [Alphaproteobacteria bacterium]|nr:MAG: trigger factor [Alphaproteobacteria bacterium]